MGPTEEKFAEIFYQDMCQLSRKITTLQKIKEKDVLEKNGGDKLFTQRVNHFRNLQVNDPEFNKKKEKMFWPLYTFKTSVSNMQSVGSRGSKKSMTSGPPEPPENSTKAKKREGKNTKLFNKLESVQAIKKLHPISHGKPNALLDGGDQSNGKFNQLAVMSDPELDSDEEAEMKKSFFE